MTKKEFKIEDLPGVGAATAEKLREAGYDNLMSIAVSSPGEMIEVAGVSEGVAKRIINVARSKLDMGFESGEDLLKKREQIVKITTGCKAFDSMLQGGFESGSISECYGEFGSSKSQIAHVLAVRTQLPKEQGGADGSVIFIDGESTFRPERIQQISSALNLDPLDVLKNIKVARAFNSDHQVLLAEKSEEIVKEGINGKPVKLIVVDSLTSHFRADFTGRGQLSDRQQKLNKHMHTLMKLANQYNLCVYVTNQVMARPDVFFGDPTAAIGGNIVGHNCLVPWTLIQLNDGSIKPISEIYDYNKVCSIDLNTFKSKTEKIGTIVYKQNKEDLYRIRTNREIDTSGTHRFFKIENFKIVEVKANELREEDYIAQGFDFDIDGEEQKLPNFEIERLVNISEEESNKLKKFLKEKGITRKALCKSLEITPRQLRRVLNQGYPTNLRNFEIFKESGIPVCMNAVQTYKYREITIPDSFNPEFAQIMGYFLGDGNLEDRSIRFRDARIDVLQYYQKSLENIFSLKIRRISKVKNKECFNLELNGTVVRDLFKEVENNLFDYVCKSPKQHICRFIKGFFDAEGSVDKKSPRISASQKDGQVLQYIQLLLDRLGIRSRIRAYTVKGNKIHQLDIADNKSVLKYIQLIGMTARDKSDLLNKWGVYCEESFTQEMTPIKRKDLWSLLKNQGLYPSKFIRSRENPKGGYEYVGERELRNAVRLLVQEDLDVEIKEVVEFLNTLLCSEMKFEMIKKISRVKYDGVLVDFEVPTTNNYIANGFVVHNSQTRIYLRKGKKGSRVAKLVDSPHIADSECAYMVTESGLKDLE